MVPLSAIAHFAERADARPRSTTRTPSSRRRSRSTSPKARRSSDAQARDHAGRGRHRHADQRARQLPGHRAQRAAVARPAAAADRRGDRRDLHRARHAVREPGASGHGAVDAAVGRRRRGAGAADVQDGVLDHRADRRVPADRHRQEERDPDHRLRARGRARARPVGAAKRCARPACCASGRS